MKKLVILLCVLMLGKVALSAETPATSLQEKTPVSIVLTGNLVFDWLDISQIDRDAVIEKYKTELFGNDTVYKYGLQTPLYVGKKWSKRNR